MAATMKADIMVVVLELFELVVAGATVVLVAMAAVVAGAAVVVVLVVVAGATLEVFISIPEQALKWTRASF